MSFIAKNPISAAQVSSTPSAPIKGTRGLFAKEDGWYDIDDNGNTFRYLNDIGVNLTNYKDKVESICTLFSLKIDGELVRGVIGYGTNQTYKQLHNFLQGVSHLSTLQYLD